MTITNPTDQPARTILLGGPPFTEQIIMWWNFVGRTHEEIVEFREQWEASGDRFGTGRGIRRRRRPHPCAADAARPAHRAQQPAGLIR